MKIGKLNSRISRVGQKLKSGIGDAVGKTQKVIQKGERGVVKGINAVASVADSKAARSIQQASLIAGRTLGATGIPELQASGVALTGIGTSIKETRRALPDKIAKQKRDVARSSNKLQGRIASEKEFFDRNINRGVRNVSQISGNELERAPPMSDAQQRFAEMPQYVD